MKFALSAEQRQFTDSLHDFLVGAAVPTIARAWADGNHEAGRKLWRGLGELGVTALLIPDEFDGLAAETSDVVVAFEGLGYHAVPGPLVESIAVLPTVLRHRTADSAVGPWLQELAQGTSLGTVEMSPHVPFVLDADIADLTLRVGESAVERITRAALEPRRSIDATRRLFSVQDAVTVPVGSSGTGALSDALDIGALAVAAQLVGAGQHLLDTATEYAKQRHQYGRPIGQFQAIKHLLADTVTKLELARPLVYGAAVTMNPRDVSAAKVAAGDAAYLAARTALQVHGAIGYTAEHDLGLWLTKVRALVGAWGVPSFHRKRVLTALSAPGSASGTH